MTYERWYHATHPELTHHGLWLRGGELNTLPREEYDRRSLRALFVRLSTYFDTGYSFTHQILYQLAAGTEGVYPDLGYLPPRPDAAIFERDRIPWLLGTQSKRGPEDFDLVGFSNSIVQELVNLPHFLTRSGIPLTKSERLRRSDLPLIVLGGANALYSTSAWLDDPWVDLVFVGESDEAIKKMLIICRDAKAAGRSKLQTLALLEALPGFFQPDRPRETRKSFVWDLNRSEPLRNGPVYSLEEPLGSAHLQISEGCPCFCSFCAETWDRKPYRERSAEKLLHAALELKASMGLEAIDLYSFNFNLHAGLYQVLWDLVPNFRHIGLKSQRFDLLAHDPEMLKVQQLLGKTSLTCGLEGISPRLRRYLSKNLEEGDLEDAFRAILKMKARELKVFLIATGLEEDEDLTALEDLLTRVAGTRRALGAQTRLIFSMTPLVRFPWTPMEFEDAFGIDRYERIIRKTAGRVRAAGFEFRESADLPEYWVSQILVRADRPGISRALLRAIQTTGFTYYREVPESFMRALSGALSDEKLDPVALLRGFDLETSRSKPWARIQTGVKREFLWERALLAREHRERDYCLGRGWTKARCSHCGGCPTRHHVRAIVLADQRRGYTVEQLRERLRKAQNSERKVELRMSVGDPARGLPRKIVGVALARALMLSEPSLTPCYRGYAGAFWSDEERPVWVTGADSVTLLFREEGIPILNAVLASSEALERVNATLGAWGRLEGRPPPGWTPQRLRVQTPIEPRVDAYLKARGLKYTLRKRKDSHAYSYELLPQSLKKGHVTELTQERLGDSNWMIELGVGPKFALAPFASEALISGRSPSALARMIITGLDSDPRPSSDPPTKTDPTR